MTKLLEKAFSKASRLSDDDQNLLAKHVLAEIESDQHWDQLFRESQDELAQLATKTLREHRQGKTKQLDMDRL